MPDIDFERFEVLTFDCYGTLIDWEAGIIARLRRVLAPRGIDTDNDALLERYASHEAAVESGPYLAYREVLAQAMRAVCAELGVEPTDGEVAAFAGLMQALKLYKLDNQRFPSGEQGLEALVRKPTVGMVPPNCWKPYLDKLPNDPWGRPYQYVNPGVKCDIDVFSFGADGQPGGDGINAHIGSWDMKY